MSIGDAIDYHLQPPAYGDETNPQIEKLLDLADDLQGVYPGSRVEIVVHIPSDLYTWGGSVDVSDNPRNYTVRLERRS